MRQVGGIEYELPLLEDLRGLQERVWLVIDDVHELRSDEALRQLELLLVRAPAALRIVLASRHDVPLGLHRLRLAGELTEIRTRDLLFTLEEARALWASIRTPAAAVVLPRGSRRWRVAAWELEELAVVRCVPLGGSRVQARQLCRG